MFTFEDFWLRTLIAIALQSYPKNAIVHEFAVFYLYIINILSHWQWVQKVCSGWKDEGRTWQFPLQHSELLNLKFKQQFHKHEI